MTVHKVLLVIEVSPLCLVKLIRITRSHKNAHTIKFKLSVVL